MTAPKPHTKNQPDAGGRLWWSSLKDRLLIRRTINPETNCWEWTGSKTKDGYGRMHTESGPRFVHRVAYEIFVGPIPEGMKVLHACDNPCCLNPEHLRVGTVRDNITDMTRKGRAAWMNDKPYSNNSTGIMGVSFRNGRYVARFKCNGKNAHIGQFDTAEEARDAYLKAKRAAIDKARGET